MSSDKNPIRPPKVDPEELMGQIAQMMQATMGGNRDPREIHVCIQRASNGFIVTIPPGINRRGSTEVFENLDDVITRLKDVFQ
jgi:hypothetical protein